MLRVVPAPSEGQAPAPSKRRRWARADSLCLTTDEHRHLGATLRNLRWAYGSWGCLAKVIGCPVQTVRHAATRSGKGSAILAVRAAKAGGVSVESVLSGVLGVAGKCSTCGHRLATGGAS